MKVRLSERNNLVVARLRGRVTLEDGVEELWRLVSDLATQGRARIVLDVKDLKEIDSSGLAALIEARGVVEALGGAVKLARASQSLERILRLTRLHLIFETFLDNDAAVRSFRMPVRAWSGPVLLAQSAA